MQDESSKNFQCYGESVFSAQAEGDSWLESILGLGTELDSEEEEVKEYEQAEFPRNSSKHSTFEQQLVTDFGLDLSKLIETSKNNAIANRTEAVALRARAQKDRAVRCPSNLIVEKVYSDEEYASLAELYFARCEHADERPTMSGLALALGLSSISGLERLGIRNPALRSLIGRAFLLIQHFCEGDLFVKGATDGAKFTLKNIPDGFPEDPRDQIDLSPYWKDTKQIAVTGQFQSNVVHEVLGETISPERAYEKLIRGERIFDSDAQLPSP